jgi:hypothetical protein
MEEMRNGRADNILIGKCEAKRLLGQCRRRWEDNIKINLKEIGSDDVDSTGLG